jgi:hypothetical protein
MRVAAVVAAMAVACARSAIEDAADPGAPPASAPTGADAGTPAPPSAAPSGADAGTPSSPSDGGSPAASACEGISAPDLPAMVQHVQPPQSLGTWCGGGVADLSGTLGLVVNGAHGDGLELVSSSGTLLQEEGMSMFGFALQQPSGFMALSGRPYLGPEWALQYGAEMTRASSSGDATDRTFFANFTGQLDLPAAADPNGGALVAGQLSMGPEDPPLHAAVMFENDLTGPAVRWGPVALGSSGVVLGLGVDLLGRSLILFDGAPAFGPGSISAQWLEKDGSPLTGEFLLLTGFSSGPSTWFETTALIGGGLLVRRMDGTPTPGTLVTLQRLHSQALVVVESGSQMVRTAPAWMLARKDVKLQLARGGTAYAALPLGANGVACSQRVEVIAPDGTSCGATDYAIASGTCDTQDMTLGADGTVIQQLPSAMETVSEGFGTRSCTWRWWPAALR